MRPFVIAGQTVELSARGLKIIRNDPYWVASDEAVSRGFTPRTIHLHYALTFKSAPEQIVVTGEAHELSRLAQDCEKHWLEMLDWMQDPEGQTLATFDGTVETLVRCYQTDPESPYQDKPQSTQQCYADWCTALVKMIGKRRVDRIKPRDFRTYFKEFLKPAQKGGRPRVRLATGCIKQMMPILLRYGYEIGIEACGTLLTALETIDLRVPPETLKLFNAMKAPQQAMSFEQAEAIVKEGIRIGTRRSLSVAIGVASQFEFTIAQIDTIGWWEKNGVRGKALGPDAIVHGNSLWHPGLCFEDFMATRQLDMRRNKNGRGGLFTIDEYPLFLHALEAIPAEWRTGPVAIDNHGKPFFDRQAYGKAYREIANAVGVPKAVWNMNARHGGATEADDAGAELSDISTHLQHANTATTKRHYIKPTAEPNVRVARKRVSHREKKRTA